MRFSREICALLLLNICGCAMFRADSGEAIEETLARGSTDLVSPPGIQTPVKHVLRVEPAVIRQRADETRIREQVWEKLCECGLMSPGTRHKLNQNGFRVGVSGATMPWALDSLMQKHRRETATRNAVAGDRRQVFFSASGNTSPTIALPEGSESVVIIREASGTEIPSNVDLPGLKEIAKADNVRCVLRLTTSDCSNGSALVHVLPELRFGREAPRFEISNGEDRLAVGQRTIPLYDEQFEVRLHAGDSVVVGYSESREWTPGRFFFVSDSLTYQEERLLVLRLGSIETVEGQRSLDVSYSKW